MNTRALDIIRETKHIDAKVYIDHQYVLNDTLKVNALYLFF